MQMQLRINAASVKYKQAWKGATTENERQSVREEYERDVREIVHGERLTVDEAMRGALHD